jgi:hypothetical protein
MKSLSTFVMAFAVFTFLLSGCSDKFSAIERGFVSPPDSIRTGTNIG